MNASNYEVREFDFDDRAPGRPSEKFRMSRKPHEAKRKRPKQVNGIHRRRRKKIRL